MSARQIGYVFRCKACGKLHLMKIPEPYGVSLLDDVYVVPCARREGQTRTYSGKDFRFIHGEVTGMKRSEDE